MNDSWEDYPLTCIRERRFRRDDPESMSRQSVGLRRMGLLNISSDASRLDRLVNEFVELLEPDCIDERARFRKGRRAARERELIG